MRVVRLASLVAVLAAAVVMLSVVALPWYQHIAYADGLTAWEWVPEVGLDLALAGVAAAVGLAGGILSERLPRWLAVLGTLASIGLTGLIVYRAVRIPDIGIDIAKAGKPGMEPGLPIAIVAGACLVLASLAAAAVLWASRNVPRLCRARAAERRGLPPLRASVPAGTRVEAVPGMRREDQGRGAGV